MLKKRLVKCLISVGGLLLVTLLLYLVCGITAVLAERYFWLIGAVVLLVLGLILWFLLHQRRPAVWHAVWIVIALVPIILIFYDEKLSPNGGMSFPFLVPIAQGTLTLLGEVLLFLAGWTIYCLKKMKPKESESL